MQPDFTRPWRATHVIHTNDPALAAVPVMLCAVDGGDGAAYTRDEWEEARQLTRPPTPVWTRRQGRWFALGTAATLREGRPSFWAEPARGEQW